MKKSAFDQTFYGFLRAAKVAHMPGSKALLALATPTHCSTSELELRITAQLSSGKIDAQRAEDLSDFLSEFHDAFMRSEQLIDCRDARDWSRLPGGGHMRVAHHMDADTNDHETRQKVRR